MFTKINCYLSLFLVEEGCTELQLRVKNILRVQTCQAFVNSIMVNKKESIPAQNHELKPNSNITI